MNWTGEFYKKVFDRVGVTSFALRENDYVFGDQKFAGNAQEWLPFPVVMSRLLERSNAPSYFLPLGL